ncbi:MAG TPA: hypothetical protein VH088_02180 [Terriglobales bacterium]|nr:hypothetical protein [Terriglobales bacterium]
MPSKDGKAIFAIGTSRRAEVVRYDTRNREFVPYLAGNSGEGLAFSHDRQWVTYTSYPDGTLWRSKVDGSERFQLTFPPLRVMLPRWSPDGRQIAFNAALTGAIWNIYLISSEGGTPRQILPSEQSQMDANWSPDGNSLVFASASVRDTPVSTIDLKTRHVTTLPGSTGLYSPHWSPDGRYIAAITTTLPHKLMLFDFSTQQWTEAFAFETSYETWSRDGKYIYFQSCSVDDSCHILRFRLRDRGIEKMVDVSNIGRLPADSAGGWFGLAPDDSPLVARNISTQEIYALEMDWR